jgi:3-isopropylmalate dehydrogenase
MKALIAVLPGDGIGAEVTAEAVRALAKLAARYGHDFQFGVAPIQPDRPRVENCG